MWFTFYLACHASHFLINLSFVCLIVMSSPNVYFRVFSGKTVELPFVSNPFLDEDNVVEMPRPAATKPSKQPVPSPPLPPKKAYKNKRKGGAPSDRGEGSKKLKPVEAASTYPVSSLFGVASSSRMSNSCVVAQRTRQSSLLSKLCARHFFMALPSLL